jgi:hypothetical protein
LLRVPSLFERPTLRLGLMRGLALCGLPTLGFARPLELTPSLSLSLGSERHGLLSLRVFVHQPLKREAHR